MFCVSCGKKNPDDANFCFSCGAAIHVRAEDTPVNAPGPVVKVALPSADREVPSEPEESSSNSQPQNTQRLNGAVDVPVSRTTERGEEGSGFARAVATDVAHRRIAPAGEPVGIGGWLLVLCLALTVGAPIVTVQSVESTIQDYKKLEPLLGLYPRLRIMEVVDITVRVLVCAFAVVSGFCLLTRRRHAVRTVRIFFIANLIGQFLIVLSPYVAGLSSEAANTIVQSIAAANAKMFFGILAWWAYVMRSRRVRNTYGLE